MLIVIKFLLILIVFYVKTIFASEECVTETNLKIGIIENEYIDYQYYIYYELGNFAQENKIEFDVGYVENNINEFDIVFGEWDRLSKLSLNEISLPNKINQYYKNNGIKIKGNILPLDLDTFIVLSNQNLSVQNLEELINFYSPIKYTFGMSFNKSNDLLKLISFTSHQGINQLKSHTIESTLNSFEKLYTNSNKNILNANFIELYNSFESKENLFTLFNDGVLLYKNLQDKSFNIFPQSKYIWDEDLGVFKNLSDIIPYSFYGFSAYINNTKQIGLLCHFVNENVRDNTFKNFNIQISPLSINELSNFENLPDGYEEIVKIKNQNIISNGSKLSKEKISLIRDIILRNNNYHNLIKTNNYLN